MMRKGLRWGGGGGGERGGGRGGGGREGEREGVENIAHEKGRADTNARETARNFDQMPNGRLGWFRTIVEGKARVVERLNRLCESHAV